MNGEPEPQSVVPRRRRRAGTFVPGAGNRFPIESHPGTPSQITFPPLQILMESSLHPSAPPADDFDELGAHVSAAGGIEKAPGRAREIESVVMQLFTKQPNRWAEPTVSDEQAAVFRQARTEQEIRTVACHDSYLINLATEKPDQWERAVTSFSAELRRCHAYGIDLLVTHPGNATDGDFERGVQANADGLSAALRAEVGETLVLLEITAGTGTSVGATFENLAAIIAAVPEELRARVGVCFDTCHAWAAGYHLADDWDGVWQNFDETVGLDRLRFFHVNDSQHPFDSRKDRHAGIGEGTLGLKPFEFLMTDPRFADIPKVLETPKGDDVVANDLRNLGKLRAMRG